MNDEDEVLLSEEGKRDLTRREINALVSVSQTVCLSESIEGEIDFKYLQKKLYVDKRESIDEESLIFCAKLVNKLRSILPKKDESAGLFHHMPLRQLRNIAVKFANTSTKFRERKMFPEKSLDQKSAIFVTPATMYLMFKKDYDMVDEDAEVFTNYQEIQDTKKKRGLLKNFFAWNKMERIFSKRKLTPMYSFYYNDCNDLLFLGKLTDQTKNLPQPSSTHSTGTATDASHISRKEKEDAENDIRALNGTIKAEKKELAALKRSITSEESERMDLAKKFRRAEKANTHWDMSLYKALKAKRDECNHIYDKIRKLDSSVKVNQCRMYALNKKLHQQQQTSRYKTPLLSERNLKQLKSDNVLIQGIDPGVVTTASAACIRLKEIFEDVNRFQALSLDEVDEQLHTPNNQYNYQITAALVNQRTLSTSHRKERERRKQLDKQLNQRDLQRKRVTRKIRKSRFYKRYMSSKREEVFHRFDLDSKQPLFTFVGNWSGNTQYLRGHARRSLKPIIARLKSVENDEVHFVDEYKSTITCSSCFEVTTKQVVRTTENKKRRIKGAVACLNSRCPRRLATRSTTINRDTNGARNIALIGLSSIISTNGRPLPPFQRGVNESNKYVQAQIFH